jgi:CRP/FNR family transcriptional regulator
MLNSLCLPLGMSRQDIAKLDSHVTERIRIPKGAPLFSQGEHTDAVYGIRTGVIKTQLVDASGQTQITGFLLQGEIVGMDGLLDSKQLSDAIALEDTEVCVIRVNQLDELGQHFSVLQLQLRRLMGKEIQRSHQMVMSLGVLRSEQRVAAFLLNMSQRLAALGYSSTEFVLRMSREEIGNYLGLTLETVSRLFSRFARDGLIKIRQREVQLLDVAALQQLAGTDCA